MYSFYFTLYYLTNFFCFRNSHAYPYFMITL
nr:MAG TPA: hypothetical protein [Caudoviricetes sp.]DAR10378.1 MAG TPA: hypothetical protein [Caudoviricetes sp.]